MVSVWKLVGLIATAVGAVVGLAMMISSLTQHRSTPSSGGASSSADSSGAQSSGCSHSYTTVADDSCTSIAQMFGISVDQFLSLNPSLSANCTNLHTGVTCCVRSSSGGDSGGDNSSGTDSSGDGSSGDESSGDESSGCSQSYSAVTGDSCTSIAQSFGISVHHFLSLNPSVSSDCTNLHIGTAYCVESSGADSGSSGDESSSSGDESSGDESSGDQSSGCSQSYAAVAGDSCTSIAQNFGISVHHFLSLNPSVSPDCTNLHIGAVYCVESSGSDSSGDESSSPDSGGDQSSGCSQSYTAVMGDSCNSIAQNFGISVDQFLSLNPSVSPDCTNLHVGTAYCV